ncbi:MAG: thermonuclease family protein [Planctomycetota bacterium]
MIKLKFLVAGILTFVMLSCADGEPSGYVTEVTDGVTYKAPYTFIDSASEQITIQLAGVGCDDMESQDLKTAYFGARARHYAAEWLKQRVTVERPVRDTSGRLIRRWVLLKSVKDGEYLHEALLREGLAFESLSGIDLPEISGRIRVLEQEARAKKVGRWAGTMPDEREMAEWVSNQRSLLGGLMANFTSKTPSIPSTPSQPSMPTPEPVNPPVVPTPDVARPLPSIPATMSPDGAKVVAHVDALAKASRDKFLQWQASDAGARVQGAPALRSDLRAVKIAVMDALDDSNMLDAVQRAYLESIREDMNRVMKIIDAVVKP